MSLPPEFQIFIKPAGPACNLGCSYCYYLNNLHLSGNANYYIMPDRLLRLYIRQHIEATKGPVIHFSWHGGEPLLAGLEFYRKVVSYQNRYCPKGKKIINGIQTNGTMIDESWCRFLAERHFAVGISMDGPGELHNIFRVGKNGNATFRNVRKGYDMLLLHGIDPEILCVVNSVNVKYPLLIYRYFRNLGAKFMTFLPLVELRADQPLQASKRSVPPEEFGFFLCSVFDEWIERDIGKVKVQIFEEALRTAFGQDHTLCIFKKECGGVPVVEKNGNFYSCDHFVDAKHLIGNIKDIPLSDLMASTAQSSFGKSKQQSLPKKCTECRVIEMCNGECPKNRFNTPSGSEHGLNYLCKGYEMFFSHCMPFVNAVAASRQ